MSESTMGQVKLESESTMGQVKLESESTMGQEKTRNLISREEAINAIENVVRNISEYAEPHEVTIFCEALAAIESTIVLLPAIDPVTCGDCIHWICHDRRCGYWNHGVKPRDWCSHAERSEDGRPN